MAQIAPWRVEGDGYGDDVVLFAMKVARQIPLYAHLLLTEAFAGMWIIVGKGLNRWRNRAMAYEVLFGFKITTRSFYELEEMMGKREEHAVKVSFLLFTVTFHANHAHNLNRSP